MSHFINADRKTDYLLPPSLEDWLNEDHLARFIVEVVDQLDLSTLTRQYAGRGSKAHHPSTLTTLAAQSETLGAVVCLIADTGFCSEKNVQACEAAKIDPLIAVARDEHPPGWRARHSEPAALPENAPPTQAMSHRLKTKVGRALYALRKQTVEPVFGIIKSVLGFRQFSVRGLAKVRGEWSLVGLAWHLKRMAVLRQNCPATG